MDEIENYIAEKSGPETAARVIDEIFEALDRLAEFPHIGHVREDFTREPVRFWTVYSFYIVYNPAATPMEVVRVIEGHRDVECELN